MCGVFGYVGKRDPLTVCLNGLEYLEYRGYDSTGIGGISKEGNLVFCKKAGKLSLLKQELHLPPLEIAIAHTRWATHGKVNDLNAHPHLDGEKKLAIVHNGIIENYDQLRDELKEEGSHFESDTDTEIVAHLLAKYYTQSGNNDLLEAIQKTLARMKGHFAFIILHKDHPNELYATARSCPLSLCYNDEKTEAMLSSDPHAFQGTNLNILYLQGDEIARVGSNQIEIFDVAGRRLNRKGERLEKEFKAPSKEGFEHYMMKEIHEQPKTISEAFEGRWDGNAEFEELKEFDSFFQKVNQVWFIGAGTSANAGRIAALISEDIPKIPAQCEISSEARYRIPLLSPQTLIVVISQSGETADTLSALREAKRHGCKVVAVCNVKNSTMMREADGGVLLRAGPEISVCSTKAFTSQLTVLTLLILHLGLLQKKISVEIAKNLIAHLKLLPKQIEQILEREDQIQKVAKKYATYDDFFFMGRRYMYPTACEAALKLKEISYVNANGYLGGELKHGPIALLHPRFPVVAFCANEQTEEKIASNLMEVKARGAPLLAIVSDKQKQIGEIADDRIEVPATIDLLAPFASAVAGQLIAYYIAKLRGCDIDQPRNLAKSVTVE